MSHTSYIVLPFRSLRRLSDSKTPNRMRTCRCATWNGLRSTHLAPLCSWLSWGRAPSALCRSANAGVWIGALSPGLAWSVPAVGKEVFLGIAKTKAMAHLLRMLTQRRARQCHGHVR